MNTTECRPCAGAWIEIATVSLNCGFTHCCPVMPAEAAGGWERLLDGGRIDD